MVVATQSTMQYTFGSPLLKHLGKVMPGRGEEALAMSARDAACVIFSERERGALREAKMFATPAGGELPHRPL